MPKTIRLRTQIGVDKSVQVDLNQDFEFLEILSLQFTQSEIYSRMCSDYGVIAGRVVVNNGYGIPNARISIFVPLSQEDSTNPLITELYPYKTTQTTNEDGYKYNLLPKIKSYSNHVPTGSFPTKEEMLLNTTWVEVFDKYYKYTVSTNDSGDFMIFGVPVGEHKIVMNLDLSDIGEFSLTPQDLIRIGRATESQVDGVKFRSSTNLDELPQIVNIQKDVTVLPLWGEPDVCQSSITRVDFDLTQEAEIVISPTSVFMGSMVTTIDKMAIKKFRGGLKNFCKVKLQMGELCNLFAGPGEILAIRQTIKRDINGFPALEQYVLENSGKVIDENGVWLVELPMNLDYVTTNEFGQQVLSNDPKIGIPTKGRYRFKIKWQQSEERDEPIKRAYFLVPNVREYGWTSSNSDPASSNPNDPDLLGTYAFSLDWSDYVDPTTAINCEDTFYEFYYNKVYTVSQLIDQYRGGILNRRHNTIKNILDDRCEDLTNPFPANDAQFRPDFLYLVFSIFLRVVTPILLTILFIQHVLAFVLWILVPVLIFVMCVISPIVYVICQLIRGIRRLLGGSPGPCATPSEQCNNAKKLQGVVDALRNFAIPNLTYPDCEMCNCKVADGGYGEDSPYASQVDEILNTQNVSILSDWGTSSTYDTLSEQIADAPSTWSVQNGSNPAIIEALFETLPIGLSNVIPSLMSGFQPTSVTGNTASLNAFCPVFQSDGLQVADNFLLNKTYFSTSLTMNAKLNLFNLKSKYFNQQVGNLMGPTHQYTGPNQVRATFMYNWPANTGFHLDNLFIMSVDSGQESEFRAGQLLTFNGTKKSYDVNAFSAVTDPVSGLKAITGSSVNSTPNTPFPITVNYADPSNPNNSLSKTYVITADTKDTENHRFPIDTEYFQVITAMTFNTYLSKANPSDNDPNSFKNRVVNHNMVTRLFSLNSFVRPEFWTPPTEGGNLYNSLPIWGWLSAFDPNLYGQIPKFLYWENPRYRDSYSDGGKQILVFCVRGVDPYSTRVENKYDLSKIFGYNWNDPNSIVTGKYKLNIPIQPGLKNSDHSKINSPYFGGTNYNDSYANKPIYFQNFNYLPGSAYSAFTSNRHQYYSSLDNQRVGQDFVLAGNTLDPNYTAYPTTSSGLVVKSLTLGTYVAIGGWAADTFRPSNPGNILGNLFTGEFNVHDGTRDYQLAVNLTRAFQNSLKDMMYIGRLGLYYGATKVNGAGLNSCTDWYNASFDSDFGNSVVSSFNGGRPRAVVSTNGEYSDGRFMWRRNDQHSTQSYQSKPLGYSGVGSPWGSNYGFANRGYYKDESVEGGELLAAWTYSRANSVSPGYFSGEFCDFSVPGALPDGDVDVYYAYERYYNGLEYRIFAPTYVIPLSNGINFNATTNTQKRYTVMRSDRLPTSDMSYIISGTSTSIQYNSFALHTNPRFAIYTFDDEGSTLIGPPVSFGANQSPDSRDDNENIPANFSSVLDTMNECGKMKPLNCYYNQIAGTSPNQYYTIQVDPNKPFRANTCTKTKNLLGKEKDIFDLDTGCYILVSVPILSIVIDVLLLLEWKTRLDITFAACRNVFSHLFTNQWINGVLYAYAFQIEKTYNQNNQPNPPGYCTDTIFLHQPTNTYYYRSSPWNDGSQKFVGKANPNAIDGGNKKYLNNPTTIIDLGAKTNYLQELVLNNNYDGYFADRLPETTLQDTSNILNYFIISRLLNANFWRLLFGDKQAGILGYFTRVPRSGLIQGPNQKLMVDGDFAQLVSINSEIGVQEYDTDNYPFADSSFFWAGLNQDDVAIGVFFNSDQTIRDLVTPRRTIFNNSGVPPFANDFDYVPNVKTQLVPFYNWKLKLGNTNRFIFGSQTNDWNSNDILSYYYQSLDRLDVTQVSNYMRPFPSIGEPAYKSRGFIFNYDQGNNLYNASILNTSPYDPAYTAPPNNPNDPSNSNPYPKSPTDVVVTVGAPFYFYFGLMKGATAIEKYRNKYVQEELS